MEKEKELIRIDQEDLIIGTVDRKRVLSEGWENVTRRIIVKTIILRKEKNRVNSFFLMIYITFPYELK